MRKKLTVIACSKPTLDSMFGYLWEILSEYIDLEKYTVEDYVANNDMNSDLVLISGVRTYYQIRSKLYKQSYIISNRYIDWRNLSALSEIGAENLIYIVNDEEASAIESIRQIREIGYEFKMAPYYPGVVADRSIKVAVTIGERDYVPTTIEKTIDIGARVPSISTINQVATALQISHNIIDTITLKYMMKYVELQQHNHMYRSKFFYSDLLIGHVFEHTNEGICIIDESLCITMLNRSFAKMFSVQIERVIGKSINELLDNYETSFQNDALNLGVVFAHGINGDILVERCLIPMGNHDLIALYANYTSDVHHKANQIRKQVYKTPKNRYRFDDYITDHQPSKKLIARAKQYAKNNANVLIQGESGTGKEILAQAIHYASNRRDANFIAVNFAAFQDSLLESELFGYAPGAFTGANKSGSIGLFEKAHNGTIFFDEIGDAPLSFQVRLLRVLQEQEIRRLGDTVTYPINVRVIAATNKNLLDMVNNKLFREDLYYRINVMPLDTYPLRARVGDINLLFNHFLPKFFNNKSIELEAICSKETIDYLMSYPWNGNTRELINVVEYFSCIKDEKMITTHDLPRYMIHNVTAKTSLDELSNIEIQILQAIYYTPGIGRYALCDRLKKQDKSITEGRIRNYLKKLNEKGLIEVSKTKGGNKLSENGLALIGCF